jgi:hypothetical protein
MAQSAKHGPSCRELTGLHDIDRLGVILWVGFDVPIDARAYHTSCAYCRA